MASSTNQWYMWEQAKRSAIDNGVQRIRPFLIRPGCYARPIAPAHVKQMGQDMKGWPVGHVAYVVQRTNPVGIQYWEAVDGSHRVEAAKAFGWPHVDIAVLGVDLPVPQLTSFAMQADLEAMKHRQVNFIEKVLVYCRLLEVVAYINKTDVCPSITEMLQFGACDHLGLRTSTKSNLQDFHKFARLAFRRERLKLAMTQFSAGLSNENNHRASGATVKLLWKTERPQDSVVIPSESAAMASFKLFTDSFLDFVASQPARRMPERTMTPKRKKIRNKRKWADAVSPTDSRKPAIRSSLADKQRAGAAVAASAAKSKQVAKGKGSPKPAATATPPKPPVDSGPEIVKDTAPKPTVDQTGPAPAAAPTQPAQANDNRTKPTDSPPVPALSKMEPWAMHDEEGTKAKEIFMKSRRRAITGPQATADREGRATGFRVRKIGDTDEYGLFAGFSLPKGAYLPLWGRLQQNKPSSLKEVYMPALSACTLMTLSLRLNPSGAGYYALFSDTEANAVLDEALDDNSYAHFRQEPEIFADKIEDGQFCGFLVTREVKTNERIIVRLER